MKKIILILGFLIGIVCYFFFMKKHNGQEGLSMKIMSSAFKNGEQLPKKYTCDGENVTPPLAWENIPPKAQSLVLILDDPDAPATQPEPWVHWAVFNIPPIVTKLDENSYFDTIKGVKRGLTNSGKTGYHGACPPHGSGVHHYRFTVYALDSIVDLPEGVAKQKLFSAIKDHVLAQATLIGTYERK